MVIVQRTNGHPLSLEVLANSFKGSDLSELNQILDDLTEEKKFIPLIKPKYLDKFKDNLEYSLQSLDEHVVKLLPKLTLFESPFPFSLVVSLFDLNEDTISDLCQRSILSRIDFDEYGEIPLEYRLYYFHTEIRKYLKQMINRNELESEYGEKFAEYYSGLLNATYMAIGKEDQAWYVRRFNTIIKGENNDFNKAIILTKNNQLSAYISITIGKILSSLGIYDVSLAYHEKALELHEKLENKNGIADSYNNIGIILRSSNKLEEALAYHEKALELHEKQNDILKIPLDKEYIDQLSQKVQQRSREAQTMRKMLSEQINRIEEWIVSATENGLFNKQKVVSYEEIQDKLKDVRKDLTSNRFLDCETNMSYLFSNFSKALYSTSRLWRFSNMYAGPIWIYLVFFLFALTNFEAIGLSTYSNSKAGVLSYVAIFENLWIQSDLYEKLKINGKMQKESTMILKMVT